MADKEPTWIYKADGSSQIVELGRDEAAPEGWSRDVHVISDPALRSADALSGIAPPVVFGADLDAEPEAEGPDALAELVEAVNKISALEALISGGSAQNEALQANLLSIEQELVTACEQIQTLEARLEESEASKAPLLQQIDLLRSELERAKAAANEVQGPAQARIRTLEAEAERLDRDNQKLMRKRDRTAG